MDSLADQACQRLGPCLAFLTGEADGEAVAAGTGLCFRFPTETGWQGALVTAGHLLGDCDTVALGGPEGRRVALDQGGLVRHRDPRVDLAAVPLGAIAGDEASYVDLDVIRHDDELRRVVGQGAAVHLLGFPRGFDAPGAPELAVRRGKTATPAYLDFRGWAQFRAGLSAEPGTSGAPVFHLAPAGERARTELRLLGLVSGAPGGSRPALAPGDVPREALDRVRTHGPDFGCTCVRAKEIAVLAERFRDREGPP